MESMTWQLYRVVNKQKICRLCQSIKNHILSMTLAATGVSVAVRDDGNVALSSQAA